MSITFSAAIIFIGSTAIPSGWGLHWIAAAALALYIPIGITCLCAHS